jgi:hypothetical protein
MVPAQRQQERQMTATSFRKIVNTAVLVFTVASLALGAAPANAGGVGFSIGVSSGDAGMTMSHSFRMGGGMEDMQSFDSEREQKLWDNLDTQDNELHIRIDNDGYNVIRQQAHDCIYVKKIKSLRRQMWRNYRHYASVFGEQSQEAMSEFRDWKNWGDKLDEAQKDCDKQWF